MRKQIAQSDWLKKLVQQTTETLDNDVFAFYK